MRRLLRVIGGENFKAAADSVRGTVPVLCGALGQVLVLCWQGQAMEHCGTKQAAHHEVLW
eukprot:1160033-Pelagomonas_calceolata.AAC.6